MVPLFCNDRAVADHQRQNVRETPSGGSVQSDIYLQRLIGRDVFLRDCIFEQFRRAPSASPRVSAHQRAHRPSRHRGVTA